MNITQYQALQDKARDARALHVDSVRGPDRTLVFGYTTDRSSFHVYVFDGQLHRVVYDGGSIVHDYQFGAELPVSVMRPKGAYPERTDFEFASLMAEAGEPLAFLSFKGVHPDGHGDGFHAPIVDSGGGLDDSRIIR